MMSVPEPKAALGGLPGKSQKGHFQTSPRDW
jgi:hypothetical protein